MKKNIPEATLDAIVADKLLFNRGTKEIAEKHGLSRAYVDATVATYRHVAAGNWEKIKFMLDGAQVQIRTVEWAAQKCGVSVPDSFYPKEEPAGNADQLEEQTKIPGFDSVSVKFSASANNTLHALIDALNRNADEAAQLRKAVFALLNSAAVVD